MVNDRCQTVFRSARRTTLIPRIDQTHTYWREVFGVAGHDGQPMSQRRRSNQPVGRSKCLSIPADLGCKTSPSMGNVHIDKEDSIEVPVLKVGEPHLESGALAS